MKTFQTGILLFLLLSACFIPAQVIAGDNDYIELTVMKNDCLINICGRYLEDPRKWPEIGRINHLKNNNLIQSGSRLIIPVRLLKGVPVDGRVAFLKGVVEVREKTAGGWKPLRQGELVRQGSLLRTGEEGAVEIAFEDGTGFLLRSDTTLDLKTSQHKGSSHLFQRFILSTGRLLTKIRRATGRDSRIEIRTPSMTAGARGTDFRVSIGREKSSTCEVLQGDVDVEGMRKKVIVREGEGTRVNRGEPPLKPRKLLPPPSPTPIRSPIRSMPFSIEFERIKGAVSYRSILSKDQLGKDVIRENVIKGDETLKFSGLDDGAYYLQMQSIDEIGLEGPSGAPIPLTVRLNPIPPFIRQPADGARIKGKSLTVTWLKVQDADRYRLQIATDKDFRRPLENPEEVKDTRHEISLSDLGTYYLRICSVANDGYAGVWSDPFSFTLIPPPAIPDVEKPDEEGKELRIRWRDQGEKMTYHIQVARDEAFRNPFVDRKVERAEAVLPMPEEVGSYYVRISAIDPDGFEGAFSPPQTFEVKRRLWPYAVGGIGVAGLILLILL